MVPRDLVQQLSKVHQAYVGKLARWTRAQPAGLEGLYTSPLLPAAADRVDAVVRDLATRYEIDGPTSTTRAIPTIASTTAAARSARFARPFAPN